jgi:hypothetical protein
VRYNEWLPFRWKQKLGGRIGPCVLCLYFLSSAKRACDLVIGLTSLLLLNSLLTDLCLRLALVVVVVVFVAVASLMLLALAASTTSVGANVIAARHYTATNDGR